MVQAFVILISGFLVAASLSFYLYVIHNDKVLSALPPEATAFSPERVTAKSARLAAELLAKAPISIRKQLPPKTGRRYIVVGGAGFLGGWIVVHLLQRGENPQRIRILDIRAPTRSDLTTGSAKEVEFIKVDISDAKAVDAAFRAPWPTDSTSLGGLEPPTSVFHTAANIRFYERHPSLLAPSVKVNADGTQNIINAARATGVTVLVYTSSGSVAVRRSRFWLWPWQKEPKYFVQVLNDDDNLIPKAHDHFFSNYAATKIVAERKVRKADGSSSGQGVLRTGCIRPGNGVFGPGGDILCGAYLVRKTNPTWIPNILQHFTYVENCSLAHLLYEKRLLETTMGTSNPDIGGQAFMITDAGPPVTYGDVYRTLETLTDGETHFPMLSPTLMLTVSHVIEAYYLSRFFLLTSRLSFLRAVAHFLPSVDGDLVNLQPSLFALTMVHLIFDDSRARLPAEKGGLGYVPAWTTLEGLCKTVEEHKKADGKGEERSMGGGVSFGFGLVRAERGVEKISEGLGVSDATQMLN